MAISCDSYSRMLKHMWVYILRLLFTQKSVRRLLRMTAGPVLASLIIQWAWEVPVSQKECYLVDPASSHMLVSKIKPCMCKYELIQTVKLRMAH
jgi:hypothetical protein